VIGILTASTATGQLVFLPLLANLTDHFGWRIALGLMCGMLGLAALAVSMVMRDHPGDVGLRPFGDTGAEPLCATTSKLGADHCDGARRAARRRKDKGILDSVRDIFHLWR
jgi:sugar phosphate permease